VRNTKNAKGDIDMIFWDRHTGILQYIYAINIFHVTCDMYAICVMCNARDVQCVLRVKCVQCMLRA
jgi:hypothetical protein